MRNQTGRKNNGSSTADSIYLKILGVIFERKLLPGTRLKEEELCEVFNFGRGGIRKVLQRLSHEKLVDLEPNSGAFVAKPTIKEAKEIFQTRRLIEAELVRELVAQFTPEKRQALEEHVGKEQEAHDNGNHNQRIRLSGEFHMLIGQLADKSVLTDFLSEIIPRTSLIITLYQRTRSSKEHHTLCLEHSALIDALDNGDVDQAVALMMDHLNAIEDQLELEAPMEAVQGLQSIFAS